MSRFQINTFKLATVLSQIEIYKCPHRKSLGWVTGSIGIQPYSLTPSLQARYSELGHAQSQRLLEESVRHAQEMEAETGRLRAAGLQAERALESREKAHRQRVKGLEGQVASPTPPPLYIVLPKGR